jgi:YfiH family protein
MASPEFLTSTLLQSIEPVRHGFFTRLGGVSSGIFSTLNCSLFSEDEPNSVRTNRSRVMQRLHSKTLFSLKQIHSNNVVVIDGNSDSNRVVQADAMVTDRIGVALGVMGADCAAVLFADLDNRIIAAAHSGWQGALSGVTDNVIDTMCDLGARKGRIAAAIGPAIQKQSYEVGDEFMSRFLKQSDMECEDCFSLGQNGQGIHFDLPLYLEHRLFHAGVDQVDRLVEDTYSDEKQFFSYRRSCHKGEEFYGRQISAISLR